ncbi:MAG: hypothetical protein A3H96_14255 [Acidobacteria bacterium RIFCSPLOWO2_02_FULL_67_36]|nr:MAG: hypothetical protein A3H96_14255 [Acidobacteria bacterium RIFCSPLOWO2_02_FULL_67_36]OFW18392.1 MAG: hypothetical protein A3G21_07765 [Acidobacteria bacterium RIFCSPLOWO2_12_FULL_66_21]
MTDNGRFTIGVFQDIAWARRGIEALLQDGFVPESLTVMAKESTEAESLIESTLGAPPDHFELKALGPVVARGPLVAALQGNDQGLTTAGLGRAITRAGFQSHDGYIFETLTGRGGVLVGVRNEPRSADALAKLHSYGGGNAAIGAWTGRV